MGRDTEAEKPGPHNEQGGHTCAEWPPPQRLPRPVEPLPLHQHQHLPQQPNPHPTTITTTAPSDGPDLPITGPSLTVATLLTLTGTTLIFAARRRRSRHHYGE
ncbi:hypothetical protein [Salinispora arenicola]|uniref:hypothetical protein n=1 Tax=Salinispora arenicola TaxID=168697 RepID=UPI003F5CC4FA